MGNIRWDLESTFVCWTFAFSTVDGRYAGAFLGAGICYDRYRETKRIICGVESTHRWPVGIIIFLAWGGSLICSLLEVRL